MHHAFRYAPVGPVHCHHPAARLGRYCRRVTRSNLACPHYSYSVNVLGNGIASLITAVCAALMRMCVVFVVGSVTQLLILVAAWVGLQFGWGVDGMLWLLALGSVVNALVFAFWLAPILFIRGTSYQQPLKPVMRLGISAWLTNLAQGALLKQISIILLGYFAISIVQIGCFHRSFQLAHAPHLRRVSGFGGVAARSFATPFRRQ